MNKKNRNTLPYIIATMLAVMAGTLGELVPAENMPPPQPIQQYPTQPQPYGAQPEYSPPLYQQSPPSYGSPSVAPAPAFIPVAPSVTGQSGCITELNTDRTSVALIDRATGQELQHVALGQDRVQKLFSAADETWSVAFVKVRGEQKFYVIAVDLARCEAQAAVVVAEPVQEVSFAGAEAVLKSSTGEQRLPLRSK